MNDIEKIAEGLTFAEEVRYTVSERIFAMRQSAVKETSAYYTIIAAGDCEGMILSFNHLDSVGLHLELGRNNQLDHYCLSDGTLFYYREVLA